MENAAGTSRKRDASVEELNRLIVRFDPLRERAWEKYEALRRRLVKYFAWNNCHPAEDLADESLDRLAKKLQQEEILDLDKFVFGIARLVRLEAYDRMRREQQPDDPAGDAHPVRDAQHPETAIIEEMDHKKRLACLEKCMAKLSAEDRSFILEFHSNEDEPHAEHRRKIADALGMTSGAIRVRAHRLRAGLEQCVKDCSRNLRVPQHF